MGQTQQQSVKPEQLVHRLKPWWGLTIAGLLGAGMSLSSSLASPWSRTTSRIASATVRVESWKNFSLSLRGRPRMSEAAIAAASTLKLSSRSSDHGDQKGQRRSSGFRIQSPRSLSF